MNAENPADNKSYGPPTGAFPPQLVELANQLVLKNPDLNVLRESQHGEYPVLPKSLQDLLQQSHAKGKLILPDLRVFKNQSVAVFSDYSGESSGKYHTYSVLVCAWDFIGSFGAQMKLVRAKHNMGEKEIAFKDFGHGPVRRALPDYLAAANNLLPGFLCTVVVDKKLPTLFGSLEIGTTKSLANMLEAEEIGHWKPEIAEKALRVTHFVSFLTALLAHDGQKSSG